MESLTKEDFKEYQTILENIEKLEDDLLNLETEITRCTQRFNSMPQAKGFHDKYTDMIADIIEIKEKINEEVAKKYKKRKAIEDIINGLNEESQKLMRARYIENKKFEEVALHMNYSYRHVTRLHGEILERIKREQSKRRA